MTKLEAVLRQAYTIYVRRHANTYSVPNILAHTYTQVVLSGGWMTKLEAVLRRIVRGNVTAPGEKWLVFSAWDKALKMLSKALAANGIGAVTLAGGREVRYEGWTILYYIYCIFI